MYAHNFGTIEIDNWTLSIQMLKEILLFKNFNKNHTKGRVQKKKTEKSDIVHIWVLTHPTLPISDIQFSDIFF